MTVPAEPAGDVTVICVSLSILKVVAGEPLNVTLVVPVNPVPVILVCVPPAGDPTVTERPEIAGAARYVNWSFMLVALVPPVVETLTSTVPVPAGERAVSWDALTNWTFVAAVPPKLTVAVEVKPLPLIATVVPPAAGPDVGARLVTVGRAMYVN